ncbi:class I SAM-dependent methyltransferase [Candidatus Babeliales bacterium]|nr:class I SAM-dependent methyltransferase [Candidatus Babeliales bacterium]
MNVFENYAAYYDLLYQDKNYESEANYIDKLIQKYFLNAKSIFELGCGTGKHAMFLAKKGYFVHGVDFSNKMISFAKNIVEEHKDLVGKLNFSYGDIRSVCLNKKFDIVISLFHVVSYQLTNDDLKKTFLSAAKHLNKEGIFIFDCWYGPAVLNNKPLVRVKRFENSKLFITRVAEPKTYPNENRVDVNYQVYVNDKKTKNTNEFKEIHKMRYLFKPEVEFILEECGFKLLNFEEWGTGKEPGIDSWGVCFICKKE